MTTALSLAHALHLDPSAVALAWLCIRLEMLARTLRKDRKRIHALERRTGLVAVPAAASA